MVAGANVILTRELNASYAAVNPAHAKLFTSPFDEDLVNVVRGMREVAKPKAGGRSVRSSRQADQSNQPVTITHAQSFEGPIPPPSVLEQYDKISPGAAERIIRMAESEVEHRHHLTRRHLESEITEARLGQILAFLIGVFTIGCGTYAATHGAELAGGFIGTGGVIGLVTTFILGRKRKS